MIRCSARLPHVEAPLTSSAHLRRVEATSNARLPRVAAPLTANALRRVAPVATIACLVAACGGAEPAPRSPDREGSVAADELDAPEPRSVEEALDQIARAEERLTPQRKSATSDESTAREPPRAGATGRAEAPVDTCASACRALASMKRAVDALCRMTADTDTRCVDARRTLDDNSSRVASCKCEGP